MIGTGPGDGRALLVAWLVLAHLAADFVFQTARIVRAKNGRGRTAAAGLAAHGAIVAACLVPVGVAYGGQGWLFLIWSTVLHVVIDRTKIVLHSAQRPTHAGPGLVAQLYSSGGGGGFPLHQVSESAARAA